jgi:AraC-like DNA-binding protein
MLIFDAERLSESPYVERVWRCHSEGSGTFLSIAESRWEIVITRHQGRISLTVRGPETKATPCLYPADGEWLGIRFKVGTLLSTLPASNLVDGDITLPNAESTSFWLHGSAWQFPDYDNADTFVDRLVRSGLLVREPVVQAALQGHLHDLSLRSVQRRFLQVAGITQNAARQIERARYATLLLRQGVSIPDSVYAAGYFDQPHLTRSIKFYIGQTPAHLIRQSQSEQLSFLYKTQPFEYVRLDSSSSYRVRSSDRQY